MQVPVWLSIVAALGTLLGTSIAFHKFIIRRPRVQLVPKKKGGTRNDGQVAATLSFELANKGYSHAEDVYVEVSLPSWNFSDNNSKNSGISFSDSMIGVEHEKTGYVGAAGERHRISVNNLIHSKSSFDFFIAPVKLEEFRNYIVRYRIGCRSYGPREGKIIIKSKYDGVEFDHTPPRFCRAWKEQFLSILEEIWSSLFPDAISTDNATVEVSDIIMYRGSFFESRAFPIVFVDTSLRAQSPLSVKLIGTITADSNEVLGTIKFTANSIKPGDQWVATVSDLHSYASRSLPATSDYSAFSKLPLNFSPNISPYLYNPAKQISIDWETEIDHPEKGDMRGVEIRQSDFTVREFAGSNRPKITVEIHNKNDNAKSLFIVGRLYSSKDHLVGTPTEHLRIDGKESDEIQLSTSLPPYLEKPDRFELSLQRTQSSSVVDFDA